jgi:hypothetical protein
MTIKLISDDVFVYSLNTSLKAQKINAKERSKIILDYSREPFYTRDSILEYEERQAKKYKEEHKKPVIPSEFKEQSEWVHWFKKTYPDVDIMSIRNGGGRSPAERSQQLLEGLLPGAADLFVPSWCLWIEFKKTKGGVLSSNQQKFKERRESDGYGYILAEGCLDGIEKLKFFLVNFWGM